MGFLIGLACAAPIGPINIEIIRRGLRAGFREPFALGMGAVTADVIYLTLFSAGVSRVIQYAEVRLVLLAFGFVVLETLGVLALRDAARIAAVPSAAGGQPTDRRSLWRVYFLGIVMMVNPMAIATWMGLITPVINAASENAWAYLWFGLSVPTGCTSWVIFICSVLHFGKRFVTVPVLRAVNIVGGVILCGFGFFLLWQVLH
jgi:threonine/homoserine/homoserine lactone efflux protein